MKTHPLVSEKQRLILKEPSGWFAAGQGFQKAMTILSDGAFKLFVWLCLQADRPTGQLETTHRQLSIILGKSRRAIGVYVQEITQHGLCLITAGSNQHAVSCFVIADDYWPYQRDRPAPQGEDRNSVGERMYLATLRESYLALGFGGGRFSPADNRKAQQWWRSGVPLQRILDALLLGACRKWLTTSTDTSTAPIGSLHYFEPLLEEVSQTPLVEDYRFYLKCKLKQLAGLTMQHSRTSRDQEQESVPSINPQEWVKES
jgi:hypothetical protein